MPELHFKGKEFVFNHHLTVPYRPLVADPGKSVGPADMAGNLVIHGDNLEALKALLPVYAGKVDCIFIDPPYNRGNEGWAYNDAVNSPMMREWLRKVVDRDDLLRHDKWLCMMWPRLRLLHELLSERGSLWMTLDDNEVHRGRAILDEIFGDECFVANLIWQKMDSPSRNDINRAISPYHDHLLVYAKDPELLQLNRRSKEEILAAYPLRLPDGKLGRRRQLRKNGKNARREDRPTLWYKLTAPDGTDVWPIAPEGWEGRWVLKESEWEARTAAGLTEWIKRDYGWVPYYIETAPSDPRVPWSTIWSDVGQNRQARALLTSIFGRDVDFENPKPVSLVMRVIEMACDSESIILDSFAGSGTTGHAVLAANAQDGGNRRFILVEMEDYADTLTAERLRRVINGYEYEGVQREELMREPITLPMLEEPANLCDRIAAIENLNRHRFDAIKKQVKDGVLTVVGEKKVTKRTEGLPGGFTFCTLGPPLDLDSLLADGAMPTFSALGSWLFYTATGTALDPTKLDEASGFLGEGGGWAVSMLYRPDRAWLESPDAALTLDRAKAIAAARPGARHLVFAAVSYVPSRTLEGLGVTHVPLPFALFRVEQGS